MFNGLNDKIVQLARQNKTPRFNVSDKAPSTINEVIWSFHETGTIIVYSGGSDDTIYNSPAVNYLFRAWHDWTHIRLNQGFDLNGETIVCREQCRQAGSDLLAVVFKLEIVSQAELFFKTGLFPVNQVLFIKNQLRSLGL